MEPTQNSLGTPPDNNLVWAILCTVLCCLPFGIVSILKANKVNTLWAQGDHEGARKAASDAKKWAIWGAIIGPLAVIIFYVIFFIIYAGALFANGY
ncbi:interferon-induced transmembrane protein [Ulvibacter sp. MAR_2010_11]|uniref:CD225/dispanin family protein n=1 Tax=Ulvibacter sp. MAR_2010_11 TaxID=1250229 RepID=UPI000C2BEE8C|nr:CD225/dispanin family protein [Ulvibacter sp. MAR_2010_11]PKA82805.1 interferon-induced transmembrane protein [Ulvibacter sp. MAR_2010_11]